MVVLKHLYEGEDQAGQILGLSKDGGPVSQGRERPLQHPKQLPALYGVLLVQGEEGRVCPLLQEAAICCMVLWKLQQTSPDEHPVLAWILTIPLQNRQQLLLVQARATIITPSPRATLGLVTWHQCGDLSLACLIRVGLIRG